MSARRFRFAVAAVAVLPVAVLAGGTGSAQEAPARSFELADAPVTLTGRVQGEKAPSSALAETDPELLGRTDAAPVAGDDQARLRRGGQLRGRRGRPGRHQPRGHRRRAHRRGAGRAGVHGVRRRRGAGHRRRHHGGRARDPGGPELPASSTAASRPSCPPTRSPTCSPSTAWSRCRRTPLNQLLTDSSPEFIGAPTIYDELDTTAERRRRASSTATSTAACGPSTPPSPTRATWRAAGQGRRHRPRPATSATTPSPPAPDVFACQNKLIGGSPSSPTYLSNPARRPPSRSRRPVTRNGHGTHTAAPRPATSSTRRRCSASTVVRSTASPPAPGCRSTRSAAPRAATAPTRRPPSRRRSSTASTSSTSRSRAAPTRSPTRSSWPSSTPTPPACSSSTSAGNDGPGAATANHLSPWVTRWRPRPRPASSTPPLTVTAGNGDVFTADGASITARRRRPLPDRAVVGRRRTATRCATRPPPPGTFAGKIVACQRGVNARVREGLQRPAGRRRRHGALQPDPGRHRDRQPLAADRAPGRRHRLRGLHGRPRRRDRPTSPPASPSDGQGDVMAAFSSRGPGRPHHQARHHRPRRADPGRRHADHRSRPTSGPAGEYFQAIAGTSMSSPAHRRLGHPAGRPAPRLDARADQSAMMTTATTDVVKEDLTTPGRPVRHGRRARRPQRGRLRRPVVRRDGRATSSPWATTRSNAVHLNIPSVNAAGDARAG